MKRLGSCLACAALLLTCLFLPAQGVERQAAVLPMSLGLSDQLDDIAGLDIPDQIESQFGGELPDYGPEESSSPDTGKRILYGVIGLVILVAVAAAVNGMRGSRKSRRSAPLPPSAPEPPGAPSAGAEPEQVFCTKCGKPMLPSDRFCPHCGASATED